MLWSTTTLSCIYNTWIFVCSGNVFASLLSMLFFHLFHTLLGYFMYNEYFHIVCLSHLYTCTIISNVCIEISWITCNWNTESKFPQSIYTSSNFRVLWGVAPAGSLHSVLPGLIHTRNTHILNRKSMHLLALTVSKKSLSHRVVETQKGERDRERRGRENQ